MWGGTCRALSFQKLSSILFSPNPKRHIPYIVSHSSRSWDSGIARITIVFKHSHNPHTPVYLVRPAPPRYRQSNVGHNHVFSKHLHHRVSTKPSCAHSICILSPFKQRILSNHPSIHPFGTSRCSPTKRDEIGKKRLRTDQAHVVDEVGVPSDLRRNRHSAVTKVAPHQGAVVQWVVHQLASLVKTTIKRVDKTLSKPVPGFRYHYMPCRHAAVVITLPLVGKLIISKRRAESGANPPTTAHGPVTCSPRHVGETGIVTRFMVGYVDLEAVEIVRKGLHRAPSIELQRYKVDARRSRSVSVTAVRTRRLAIIINKR
eukprot:1180231-Prorocentrum_minimum.AAC.1